MNYSLKSKGVCVLALRDLCRVDVLEDKVNLHTRLCGNLRAGHVPLERWVLGAPLALGWHSSFDSLLLWLELLPLSRANVDRLEVDLVLAVLHLRAGVTQNAQIQSTSMENREIQKSWLVELLSYQSYLMAIQRAYRLKMALPCTFHLN